MAENITKILVPMDFSPHAERAFGYATTLAQRFGATLGLVHVVEDPFVSGAWSSEVYMPNIGELLEGLIANAEQQLATHKHSASALGVTGGDSSPLGPAGTRHPGAREGRRLRLDRHGHARPHRTLARHHGKRRRTRGPEGALSGVDDARRRGGSGGHETRRGLTAAFTGPVVIIADSR